MMTLTAHPEYAFTRRQGPASNGKYHAVLDVSLDLPSTRMRRGEGDALCKPRSRFWGLERGNQAAAVNCPRCLYFAGQYGVTITGTTTTCWADPLSRAERRELARKLARACNRFYVMPASNAGAMHSQIVASAEMSDLHLDVTERAEVATS